MIITGKRSINALLPIQQNPDGGALPQEAFLAHPGQAGFTAHPWGSQSSSGDIKLACLWVSWSHWTGRRDTKSPDATTSPSLWFPLCCLSPSPPLGTL